MLLTWNVESWGEDEDGEEITKVSQQGIVVPDCCKAAQTHPLIILRYAGDDLSDDPAVLRDAPKGLDTMQSDENGWVSSQDKWLATLTDEEKKPTRFETATPIWGLAGPSTDIMRCLHSSSREAYAEAISNTPRATHCPYCGTELPGVERRPDAPPTHIPAGDGDYCSNCDERSRSCTCMAPSTAWQTVKI